MPLREIVNCSQIRVLMDLRERYASLVDTLARVLAFVVEVGVVPRVVTNVAVGPALLEVRLVR